jgi:hypothetical protein
MTIDKIKHIIGNDLFNHWASVKDIKAITKAKDLLEKEIKDGLLIDAKHYAELELLNYLLS